MRTLRRLFSILLLIGLYASSLLAQANGDYKTVKSGNWNDPTTWQVYNGNWGTATASPDSNAVGRISVLAGHTVTVTANANADSLVVESGGSLVINSGVTMIIARGKDKTGSGLQLQGLNALVVSGTLENRGNIVGSKLNRNVDYDPVVDTAVVKNGGVYNHARNGGTPLVAKWETGSTFLVTGITANYPNRVSQNFYNFTWNCPNQTRGDGQVNFYRTRVRGNITILSNGTQWGHDRDVRMCDNFPVKSALYQDTVWVDGNIEVKKAPAGQFSRLAISGGGNTNIIAVLIVKGNIVVEDSCVFGRTNSKTQVRLELGGDMIVSSGGTIYQGAANPYQIKKVVFTKKGTAKLSIADGTGAFRRNATVVGQMGWEVAPGCLLDIGTSKLSKLNNGFFVVDNGGAVKITYGTNSGAIECTGENGIMDQAHDSLGGANASNLNELAVAKNVVGSGTITYTSTTLKNVSNPAKAISRAWTITPSSGIKSGDLVLSYSPFDIPATANEKKFVTMKYSGAGTGWINKGPVNLRIDEIFGDTTCTHTDTLKANSELAGMWSVGDASLATATGTVVTEKDSVIWRVTSAVGYYAPATVGNVVGKNWTYAKLGTIAGKDTSGTYLYSNGSWTNGIAGDPELGQRYPRVDFQGTYPGQTAAGWPALATDTLNNVWLQFTASPKTGYKFIVNSVSFDICGSGTSYMKAKAYVSTDPNFKTKTEIFASDLLGSYIFTSASKSYMGINVDAGKSFYLRIYPWLDNQAAAVTGKRVIVKKVIISGVAEPGTAIQPTEILPTEFKLSNAYPNPFNPTTNIRLEIPKASNVTLKVYNILGQEVATLLNGFQDAGVHRLTFDASKLSSGVYIYRVEAGNYVQAKRMLLIK